MMFGVVRRSVASLLREVAACLHPEATMQMQSRHFSSDNGDLIDAVPFMGESISDGILAKFLKNAGDRVQVDEPTAQIETDKVTIDVASLKAGVIQKFVAKEGDVVDPGTKIAVISKSGESVTHVASSKKKLDEAAPKPPPAAEIKNENKKSKPETAPVMGKPKVPSSPPPKQSASEPVLPPKERERRISLVIFAHTQTEIP